MREVTVRCSYHQTKKLWTQIPETFLSIIITVIIISIIDYHSWSKRFESMIDTRELIRKIRNISKTVLFSDFLNNYT